MSKKFSRNSRSVFLGLIVIATGLTTPSMAGIYDDWQIYFENYGGSIRAYGAVSTCESQTGSDCVIVIGNCQGNGEIVVSSDDFDVVADIYAKGEMLLVRPWSSMDPSSPVCATQYEN